MRGLPAGFESSASNQMVRQVNEKLVLALMRKHIELSIPEIERLTSLTYPTVSSVVAGLKEKGLLRAAGEGVSRGGRKPKLVRFQPEAGVFVGVEIDKAWIKIASFSMDYDLLARFVLPLKDTSPAGVKDCIIHGVAEIQSHLQPYQVLYALGIGCPGMINPNDSTVISRSTLKWLEPVNLAQDLSELLGIPVLIDNDINVAALGEMFRDSEGKMDSWAYISVSTGVGSGIVLNQQILKGHAGGAGELGHLSVNCDGILCECGSRGCLENYISTPAISRRLGISEEHHSTAYQVLVERVKERQPDALLIYHDTIRYLSTAMIDLVNLLNPYAIIIGGAIADLGNPFLEELRSAVGSGCGTVSFDHKQLFFSKLGSDAGIYGGAVMVDKTIFGLTQLS